MLQQVEALASERGVSNVRAQLADVERLPFSRSQLRPGRDPLQRPSLAAVRSGRSLNFGAVLKPEGALLISDIMAREDYAQDSLPCRAIELLRDPSHVRDFRISEWLYDVGERRLRG